MTGFVDLNRESHMHSRRIFGNEFAAEVAIPDSADALTDAKPLASPATAPSPDAEENSNSRQHWPGLVGLLQPHAKLLALGLIAVVGEGAANLLEPWPLKLAFDSFNHSKAGHGWLNRWLQSTFGSDKLHLLEFAAAAVLIIAVLDAVCFFAEKYLTTSVGQWVMHDLRRLLYAHIQHLSLDYHKQKQTGELISRLTSDIDAIQSFIVSNMLSFLVDGITLLGMVGIMFYLNWRFTLIALSVAPLLFAVTYSYTRRTKKATREVRKKESEIVSRLQEVLSSIGLVKALAREDYEQRRLEEESAESVQIALRARSLKARLSPLVGIIVAIGTALVLWFGGRLVLAGSLSAGSLIVFIWYLGKMYKPMQDFAKMTDSYSKAVVGYERIQEIFETEPKVLDLPDAIVAPRFHGDIEFDHVSFSYVPERPILRDITFKSTAGQMIALVGPTGAGKTTVANLIGRFYDPDSGSVRIDGHDVREFQQKSLRDQMSFVLQESILFRAPVWQNIAYGKPEATRSQIRRAAELANAHEFIVKLSDDYDTIIGERGVTLSGGQCQRIAIARAIIRNTPILIMDEPSSGLDAASEKLVFEALSRLMEGKTTIVIAHRFSTIRSADMILLIKGGRIVERGKHEELLHAGGLYATLYDLQFQHDDEISDLSLAGTAA
jgi:subfamily B ATP-binding cassette protein MsbA